MLGFTYLAAVETGPCPRMWTSPPGVSHEVGCVWGGIGGPVTY